MMKSLTLFCDFRNLALRTINVLACMLLVAGVSAFTGSTNDNCSDAEFTTIYMGEHNGSKYYCSSTNGWTWQQAKTYCENNGGHLAIVNNAQENEYLRARLMSDYAWIGYSDHVHEGSYKWVDGSVGNYTNWNAGEPNNSGGDEDYTRLLKHNGKWTDRNATFKAEFVMEIPNAGTDLCPNKSLTVNNNGDCPVRLYHWVATGDIYLTTINAGSSYNLDAAAGSMYRVINTDHVWSNLLFDEHTTLTADCEQTWNVNPQYCDPCDALGGDTDGDGVCDDEDCRPNNPNRPAAPGTACNDNNPATENDVIQNNGCQCQGTEIVVVDNDNDGVPADEDCDDNDASIPTTVGATCDDNNAATEDDKILADGCTCQGTFIIVVDNDNDGVPADEDCDDNDASIPTTVGAACDDNDASTEDDKILADGCTCEGTEIVVVIPEIKINDVTVNEEDGTATLTITLDEPATQDVTATYTTSNGDAFAGEDYTAATGTITIPAGSTSTTITFDILDDENPESTNVFLVGLSDLEGAEFGDGQGTVTILDTDEAPTLPVVTIDDVTVYEEDGTAELTISIDQPSDSNVNVTYTTSNGSAIEGDDYTTTTGFAVIPAGSTSVVVAFPIVDDASPEDTEIYNVILSNPVGVTIGDPQGTITILDTDEVVIDVCDAAYTVSGAAITITGLNDEMNMVQILDADWNVLYECNSWTVACDETTVFDNLPEGDYMVSIQTTDASWNQICNLTESFTIAGEVNPCANTVTESGEIAGAQTGCSPFDAATLTSVAPAAGGSGTIEYLWLASTNGCPGSVSQAIAGATGETYEPGTLTETTWFRRCSRRAPCEAWYGVGESNCIKVVVNEAGTPGDTCNDNNPNTTNDVIQADGCSCKGETAPGETANISIGDVVVNEEDGTATVTVTIDQVLGSDLTIDYTAGDATADATDYVSGNGTLTIPAGELTGTITYPILDDSNPESTEDFNITLTNPSVGTIVDGIGVVTILDTDEDGPISTDCAAGYSVDGNAITITGLTNEMNMVQILDADWAVLYECNSWTTACDATTVFDNLPAGNYMVSIQTTDASWNQICNITESFTIDGGNGPVDADGDGVDAADDCDDNDPSVPTTVGSSCDDNNAATTNDVILADGCTCEGVEDVEPSECDVTYVATDDMITVSNLTDAVVAVKVLDENFNVAYECNGWSTACNETEVIDMLTPGKYFLQVQTYDASWTNICELFEEFTIEGGGNPNDVDGDGVDAADDCDDNDPSVPTTVGSSCDDNNAATENDVILADGCSCEGTPIVVLTCDVDVTTDGSEIVVTGLTAPIVSTKVIDTDWNYVYECGTMTTACNETEVITGLPAGTYFVSVQTYDAAWNTICNEWIEVVIEDITPVIPAISIDDVTVNEEDGTASLTISIDQPADSDITVVYSTSNGTATNGEDYITITDAIAIIPAGSTSVVVTFPIVDNDAPEATEVYVVDLTSPTGATIADPQGTITILDTDEEVIVEGTCDNVDAIRPALDLSSSCHGDADDNRVIWIEGELFSSAGNLYFVEFADGTAQLKGTITSLDNGANVDVNVIFTGKTNNGNAYTNSCSTLNHVDDWYYYADFSGTIGGETVIPHPDHGFQIGLGANVKNNSMGASGWFTLGSADGTRGDFNLDLGSLIECTDNNDNGVIDVCEETVDTGICIERSVSDVINCNNDVVYGFHIRTEEHNRYYNWEFADLVEYTDGTATLTGRVVNSVDANIGFDVEFNMTGRTNTPNAEGTKEHRCDNTLDYNSYYYYSDFTGTLNGLNDIAGLSFDIATLGNSFQLGVGASATGQANEFGASAWWSAVQTSAASNGTTFTPSGTHGDININLSGSYPTCLGNVNPLIAVDTDRADAAKATATTTEEMNTEVTKVANFSIFPNPATEYINIEVSEFAGQDVQVMVFNAIGVQTYNNNISNLNDNVISIDLAQYGNGAYTVIFQADGKITTEKFIVTKQ